MTFCMEAGSYNCQNVIISYMYSPYASLLYNMGVDWCSPDTMLQKKILNIYLSYDFRDICLYTRPNFSFFVAIICRLLRFYVILWRKSYILLHSSDEIRAFLLDHFIKSEFSAILWRTLRDFCNPLIKLDILLLCFNKISVASPLFHNVSESLQEIQL